MVTPNTFSHIRFSSQSPVDSLYSRFWQGYSSLNNRTIDYSTVAMEYSDVPPMQLIARVALVLLLIGSLMWQKGASYPGPRGWPIIRNLLDLWSTQPALKNPAKPFAIGVNSTVSCGLSLTVPSEWYLWVVGSEVISLRIPGASMLVLNSVKDVQELLVKRSGIYSDRYFTTKIFLR